MKADQRVLALVAAAAVAVGALAFPATGQAVTEKPAATDVGVTGTEIHVAVIADVDNPIAPNVLIGARDAMTGFARYINASCPTTNKCLAGRKLVVDFYDSHINATDTRNTEIEACADDVAMVGSAATLLSTVEDMRNCKDQAGATTGLPDVPTIALSLAEGCSDQTFPIVPPTVVCATAARHPQTFTGNVGRGYYFTKKYGDLHGVYVFSGDTKTAHDDQYASGLGGLRDLGGVDQGIRSDLDFEANANDLQSAYTPAVQAIVAHHSNYAQCAAQFSCTVLLRKEAALQGVTSQVKVWDCSTCYFKQFLQSGPAVEHEYVDTLFLPFYDPKEQQANPMLAHFVRYTGADKVDEVGIDAWSAGVAFRDAVDATAKEHGVNGLTRANLLAALNHIHTFDADGILGTIDLARRTTTDCHVLTRVEHGKFVRVQPSTPGTFDCDPKYVITRKLNLLTTP